MSQLNYSTRTQIIGKWLQGVLKRYTPPQGMTNDTLLQEMKFIVQDINGVTPAHVNEGLLELFLERTDRQVRAVHGARNWPSVKVFVNAAKTAGDETNRAIADSTTDKWILNPLAVVAKKVAAKEHVSVDYLYGRLSQSLLHTTSVTEEDLDEYRFSFETSLKESYGDDYANKEIAELTNQHHEFNEGWGFGEEADSSGKSGRDAARSGRWKKARCEYIPMAQRTNHCS
tara:strand:- start:215 stop:901 length:687 start_codon:yes stop_codon:yes gene_type:complete